MQSQKRRNISLCYLHLGKAQDAVTVLVERAEHSWEPVELDQLMLVRIFERTGQLAELNTLCQQRQRLALAKLREDTSWDDLPDEELLSFIPETFAMKMIVVTKEQGFDAAVKQWVDNPEYAQLDLWDWKAKGKLKLPAKTTAPSE